MEYTINLTGGTYRDSSSAVSSQVTRNFLPKSFTDLITKNKFFVLESFAGQVLFGTALGIGRGTFAFNNLIYRVCGTTLYSVNSSGTHTALGTISGRERCIFDTINSKLVIVSERRAFVFDSSTSTLTEVTDVDLQSPNSCTALNNQILYDGNDGNFSVSNVGDPSVINGINYATAESKADSLIRVYAFNQIIQMFGATTIEQWWNSGIGNPPFDKIQGGIIEVGLGALHGVSSDIDNAYFFGSDRRVYALNGSNVQEISTDAMVTEFGKYSVVSDVIMWCMDLKDRRFVVVTFPTANKSWVYPLSGDGWFEWSSGIQGGRNIANSCVKAFGKNIVEDYRNGNLYNLDFDVFTENGEAIIRQRDSAPVDGASFSAPGKKITLNKLILNIQAGVGLISGQGSDPSVMLRFSDDDGNTWSTERRGKIGKLGAFKNKVIFSNLGSFYSRIFRITASDPVFLSFRDAVVDIEVGI